MFGTKEVTRRMPTMTKAHAITKVHSCEIASEGGIYILVDALIEDSGNCLEERIYEIETTHSKAEGNRVHWLHCPYCGEKLTTD
jgi:hypothetical protein